MITELTPEQQAKFSDYIKKWTDVGLSTAPCSVENAVKDFTAFQKNVLMKENPAPVVLLDSPTKCWVVVVASILLKKWLSNIEVGDQVDSQVSIQVASQVVNQVDNQVRDQVVDQVRGQVASQVVNQVRGQVVNQVGDQVVTQVVNQVWDQVWHQVGGQVASQVVNQVRGQVAGQVVNQVRDQVASQAESQVWDQVRDQVRNQVWDQVRDQVGDQVRNQVDNQVGDQVWDQFGVQVMNQVWDQVVNQVVNQVGDQIVTQVRGQVVDQVVNQVWDQVRGQVESRVGDQVDNQVVNQVWDQVGDQVRRQVESRVGDQVARQVTDQIIAQLADTEIVYPYFDCQFWAGFFSFYDFVSNELGIKYTNQLAYESMRDCTKYGMVWPLDNICVVCQPPTIIKKNLHGLHCEDGPALSYNGDNEVWALNGVAVPKELVMTPSENLSIEFFKNEKNADVKAEFVRKYGIERMLDMGKPVDSYENYPDQTNYAWWWKSQYELWDMTSVFDGVPYQPYLKMLNQTTEIWHMEAVSPECRTLSQAIKERFGGREMRIVNIK